MPSARIQPQGRVRLNRSNPLTRGLVFAQVGDTPVNVISANRRTAGAGTPTSTIGSIGRARAYSSTSDYYSGISTIDSAVSYGTFVLCEISAMSTYAAVIAKTNNLGTAQGWTAWQRDVNNNLVFGNSADNGPASGGSVLSVMPAATVIGSGINGLGGGYDAATGVTSAYRNGVKVGSTATSGTYTAAPGYLKVAAARDVDTITAKYYLVLVWNRLPSDAEYAAIQANPWQLFEGQAPMLYAASAPTGTTVTATPGTLTASGLPASVSSATSIAGAVASLAASGQAATVTLPTAIAATIATSAATGRIAAVTLPTVVAASAATSTASGLAATVVSGAAISATTGTVTAAGQNATIATQINVAATPGASTAAGLGATIVSGAAIVASVGTVTATGLAATLVSTTTINATTATGAASGLLASIQSGAAISATTGQLIATGRTASIVSGVSINCGVGVASATGRAAFIPVATLVSCISGVATAVGLTASIALDRPAPLPNRHNLYSGLPRNRATLGAARNRIYKGQP